MYETKQWFDKASTCLALLNGTCLYLNCQIISKWSLRQGFLSLFLKMYPLQVNEYLELEEAGIHDHVICTPPWDFYIFFKLEKIRFCTSGVLVSKFDKFE